MPSSRPPLRLNSRRVTPREGRTRIVASIDSEEVWFESSAFPASEGEGGALLALTLLPAMAQGRNLDLTALPPVSSQLLDALPLLQHVWSLWNPALTVIDVEAHRGTATRGGEETLVASAGGVHSVACALDGGRDHPLLFISGLSAPHDADGATLSTTRMTGLAAALDVPLVTVATNWESWRRSLHISRSMLQGSCLMAVAHLLNPERLMIPATATYHSLIPHGTHVLIDKNWSTESTAIEHWGAHLTFADKITRVVERPDLHAALRSCVVSAATNCGRCRDCARTRLAFHLRGVDFPVDGAARAATPMAAYQPFLGTPSEARYLPSLMALAKEGNHSSLLGALERGRLRGERARWFQAVGRAIRGITGPTRSGTTELLPWGYGPAPEHP